MRPEVEYFKDSSYSPDKEASHDVSVICSPGCHRASQHVCGEILQSTDAGYEEARKAYNGLVDKRPALIAQCRGSRAPHQGLWHAWSGYARLDDLLRA